MPPPSCSTTTPTADISAVRQVRAVVKEGSLYFPSEIYAELDLEPFASHRHHLTHGLAHPYDQRGTE